MLGSSFTLAVDVEDIRARSYSSSIGSSFTSTKGGEGDDLIGWACNLSYKKKKKFLWISTTITEPVVFYILTNMTTLEDIEARTVQAEIRHLRQAQQRTAGTNSCNPKPVLIYTLKQIVLLILTVSNLGIDSLTTFIPFITVAGEELSLPTGTWATCELVNCE